MLHHIARAVGWRYGAQGSAESQLLVPRDSGQAADSTHRQQPEPNRTSATSTRPRDEHSCSDSDFRLGLATVPEDDEDSTGGHGDCMQEHLEQLNAGFCRDQRGKLQSVWELDDDFSQDAQDGGEDAEADCTDQALYAAARTRGYPNARVNRAGSQAQTMRLQGSIDSRAGSGERPAQPPAQWQLLSETPWPADREVFGPLELRGSAWRRSQQDMEIMCQIQHGVMTFSRSDGPGAEMVLLAEMSVSNVVATIVPDQTRKFSICSGIAHINRTQVWCCAKDQVNRNKWLAILHRLGVDLYCEYGDGQIQLVRQGVQAQPGHTDL